MSTADDVKAIFTELSSINVSLTKLAGSVEAEQELRKELKAIVQRHDKVLYGNGVEGLVTKVSNINTTVDNVKEDQDKNQKSAEANQARSIKWLRGLVGTMVLAMLTWGTSMIGIIGGSDKADAKPTHIVECEEK